MLDPLPEPRARRGRIEEPAGSHGGPRTDLDGMPAEALHDAEAVLVGEIVTQEHRRAARERLLLYERLDGAALVVTGELELRHHLAGLNLDAAADRARGFAHHGMRGARQAWRQPIVQRHAVSLVLEHETRVPAREVGDLLRGAREEIGGE